LQPGEFYKLIKGYEERRDSENTVASYFVANLMNLFGKSLRENITIEKLMKPIRFGEAVSEDTRKADEEYLKAKFKLGR